MPATVTLATTTLAQPINRIDTRIRVTSTSGMTYRTRLFIDGEMMEFTKNDIGTWINVRRGVDGTGSHAHVAGQTIYIGRADQFYNSDPVGRPGDVILVSPHINVLNGNVWFARGDAYTGTGMNPGTLNRWWQLQTPTFGTGDVGVLTTTLSPTSST